MVLVDRDEYLPELVRWPRSIHGRGGRGAAASVAHDVLDATFMKRHIRAMSRPLQVYMDDSELERLEAWTKKRGWTKSQAVRAALRVLTHEEGSDPLLASSGMIHGLPASLSASIDQAIQETFIASPQQNKKRRRVQRRVRGH